MACLSDGVKSEWFESIRLVVNVNDPTLVTALPDAAKQYFLFDGLDRLPDPARFADAVSEDVRVLAQAGIGCAVVGPIRQALAPEAALQGVFDEPFHAETPDVETTEGLEFLGQILRRRVDKTVLPSTLLEQTARASGGNLRDLVGLARSACREAFAHGRDVVSEQDIAHAFRQLGDSLAFGVDDAHMAVLRELVSSGQFVIRGEREIGLVADRRVLAYPGGRWAVHPALAARLDAVPPTGMS